jgi:hypothetical protein
MAIETFNIVNKIAPVGLQDLLNVKISKTFRYNNILKIAHVKTTHVTLR